MEPLTGRRRKQLLILGKIEGLMTARTRLRFLGIDVQAMNTATAAFDQDIKILQATLAKLKDDPE